MKLHTNPQTIQEVCAALNDLGQLELANRLKYFASDEDLEEGYVAVKPESVLGFWEFFNEVESKGQIDLACSPEGWICAVWKFPDQRRASIWFLDQDNVMYAARKADGYFVDLNQGEDKGKRSTIMKGLLECGEWFTCSPDQ